jgi:predicted nucleic acid-binding protein
MQILVISDTTCLVILEKIGQLDILKKLYGEVAVTTIIAKEYKRQLPDWIKVCDPRDLSLFNRLSQIVDPGEASAIALSKETDNCLLILDDLKARKLAEELNLRFTGTIGVLILARSKGVLVSFDQIIEDMQKTNFRISKTLIEKLKSA